MCQSAFTDPLHYHNGMWLLEIPKAIDQMFSYVAVVHDSRRQHPKTLHSLETILTMTILATICGAQNWVEIEQWGRSTTSGSQSF
jgi:hypothetical protein